MIKNVILLLVTSTLLPFIPISPLLLAPISLTQALFQPPSFFHNMNLYRIHEQADFKRAFKDSIRKHHPDHGGDPDIFASIKNLKKIMERELNYYDILNVTDTDLAFNEPIESIASVKQLTYSVEFWIFYFIAFMYVNIFANHEYSKPCRKYLFVLVMTTMGYEWYIHSFPLHSTLIDFVEPYTPLFVQCKWIKRFLAITIAVVRAFFEKKYNEEQLLLDAFAQGKDRIHTLEALNVIYALKIQQKDRAAKSWTTTIKNWVSKIITGLLFLLMIRNFILP